MPLGKRDRGGGNDEGGRENEATKRAKTHFSLGFQLPTEPKDVDGALLEYRAAVEADPGHAFARARLETRRASVRRGRGA